MILTPRAAPVGMLVCARLVSVRGGRDRAGRHARRHGPCPPRRRLMTRGTHPLPSGLMSYHRRAAHPRCPAGRGWDMPRRHCTHRVASVGRIRISWTLRNSTLGIHGEFLRELCALLTCPPVGGRPRCRRSAACRESPPDICHRMGISYILGMKCYVVTVWSG